jgi:hypothetical protein
MLQPVRWGQTRRYVPDRAVTDARSVRQTLRSCGHIQSMLDIGRLGTRGPRICPQIRPRNIPMLCVTLRIAALSRHGRIACQYCNCAGRHGHGFAIFSGSAGDSWFPKLSCSGAPPYQTASEHFFMRGASRNLLVCANHCISVLQLRDAAARTAGASTLLQVARRGSFMCCTPCVPAPQGSPFSLGELATIRPSAFCPGAPRVGALFMCCTPSG